MKTCLAFSIVLCSIAQFAVAQKSFRELIENPKFKWVSDTADARLIFYYQQDSWAASRVERINARLLTHIDSTKKFIGITQYPHTIHSFIVSSRMEMKDLIGSETNGIALYEIHTVTGIASDKLNSIFSNHEIFHIMAMNTWGVPPTWINEGMAVYADNAWHGKELHALAKHLMKTDRLISVKRLITKFRKTDASLSYPLLGSFVKFIDQAYGRKIILGVWQDKKASLQKLTGKSLPVLEKEWLAVVDKADGTNIDY